MAFRTIQAPGIEVHEIDRSQYNVKTDSSIPNSPTCLICGFADKGDDYTTYRIMSREALVDKYGYPQNEVERYFYNGCLEVLDNGAKLITSKLPYDNNSKDMYSYIDYYIDPQRHDILNEKDIVGKWKTINDVRSVLDDLLQLNSIKSIIGLEAQDISTLPKMRSIVQRILESNKFDEIKSLLKYYDDNTLNNVKTQLQEHSTDPDPLKNGILYQYVNNYDSTLTRQTYYNYLKNVCNISEDEILIPASSADATASDIQKLIGGTIYKVDEHNNFIYEKTAKRVLELIINDITNVEGQVRVNDNSFSNFLILYNKLDSYSNITTVTALRTSIRSITETMNNNHPYSDLRMSDNNITSYASIVPLNKSGMLSIDKLDDYLTNNYIDIKDKIRIVNISRNKFEKTNFNSVKTTIVDTEYVPNLSAIQDVSSYVVNTNDCLGIVPVIVSPANALYFLNKIEDPNYRDYNEIADFTAMTPTNKNVELLLNTNIINENLYIELSSTDNQKETLSKIVANSFPLIEYEDNGHFNLSHFKKIGIVVLTAFIDTANNNKLNFSVLESFVGSLDKSAKADSDNTSIFIDNVVNNNSNYIRCFSNANNKTIKESSIITIKNQHITSLGFYEADCEKKISFEKSISRPLDGIFGVLNNPYTTDIDLIIDAGLTNIALYFTGKTIIDNSDAYSNNIEFNQRPKLWYAIAKRFDDFVKFTRKDCMYLLDCPRPFCLEGNQKIVRKTKPFNSIYNNIIPKLKYITGINSSYTAGYCNWFKIQDDYSKDYFWCPPSIKAAQVYCYTDEYFHMWDAPAGMSRGIVKNTVDTAFSPTNDEAGKLYSQCWNYAINYPLDGIILEGLKTFLREATALDRVNVRRLMLYLEKSVVRIAKYYIYEGNTAYLRQKFVNALTSVFEKAVNGYGILDYIIKCDDDNNTSTTIDRNELHCTIAVKPVKTAEFIVLNFIVTNQSANILEEVTK